MMITIVIIACIALAVVLVLRFYPAFGHQPPRSRKGNFTRSANYRNGKFVNEVMTTMEIGAGSLISMLADYVRGNPRRKPSAAIPVIPVDYRAGDAGTGRARITWFGHSALLLELDGKRLLLDPMFGKAPTPFPWFGNSRFSKRLPFEIEQLPRIDAVLLSHDHYDHLDYGSIMKLKRKVGRFIVPLGVGNHLRRWGIDEARISEHDWWEELELDGVRLAAAPARHFSGRGVGDRNSTLWCSWVIIGRDSSIYFSGDGGYGPHFEQIGRKYGPFDLTLMECGQYDKRWAAIHMMPEETVQAHVDVGGRVMIPIHWGAFTLSFHDWVEPVERVLRAAAERNVAVSTPRIGETVEIGSAAYPSAVWWR